MMLNAWYRYPTLQQQGRQHQHLSERLFEKAIQERFDK